MKTLILLCFLDLHIVFKNWINLDLLIFFQLLGKKLSARLFLELSERKKET